MPKRVTKVQLLEQVRVLEQDLRNAQIKHKELWEKYETQLHIERSIVRALERMRKSAVLWRERAIDLRIGRGST